jgi:hypothetical protein
VQTNKEIRTFMIPTGQIKGYGKIKLYLYLMKQNDMKAYEEEDYKPPRILYPRKQVQVNC